MSALQKLDDVLSWLPSNHDYIPFKKLQERYVVTTLANNEQIAGIELISIVELLIEDGYIEKAIKDANWHGGNPITQIVENHFKLTFKGLYWIEKGSYLGSLKEKEDKNIRVETLAENQRANANRMTYLTTILSVFALLSVFLQSLEKFHVLFRVDFWLAFFLYSVGLLTGIATLLIAKEVWSRKKRK